MTVNSQNNCKNDIPKHIAVIMDGNSRWAKKHKLPLKIGHQKGSQAIKTLIQSAIEQRIKYLTIFAFSTENWHRPQEEIDNLMHLMQIYLEKESKNFIKNDIKVLISGSLAKIKTNIREKILDLQDKTKDNNKITLNVAFDYGARTEILDAFKKIISKIEEGQIDKELIDEKLIGQNMYNSSIPDPDLIIRTSQEYRLSNFMLWQAAYSELYFTKTLWPDFNAEDLEMAISEFKTRQRRYGKR